MAFDVASAFIRSSFASRSDARRYWTLVRLTRQATAIGAIAAILAQCGGRISAPPCSAAVAPTTIASGGISFVARAATVQTYRLFEISPAADPCGDAYRTLSDLKDGGLSPRNAQTLLIVLISDAPKTGSFAITSWDAFGAAGFGQSAPGLAAGAIFEHLVLGFTDLYAVGGAIRAVSGTVSVTRDIGGKRMTGRYDLLFPDGARAVGDFDAPYCNETNMCGDWNR